MRLETIRPRSLVRIEGQGMKKVTPKDRAGLKLLVQMVREKRAIATKSTAKEMGRGRGN